MSLQIIDDKKKEFLDTGAPEAVADFLDSTVEQLHEKALTEGTMYKEADVQEDEEVTVDEDASPDANVVEENSGEEESVEPTVAEDTVEKSTSDPTTMEALAKTIQDGIQAGIQAYHDTVVSPLQTELATLKKAYNSVPSKQLLENAILLPPAAIADAIRKEYGQEQSVDEDVIATDSDVEATIANTHDKSESDSGNLLADF